MKVEVVSEALSCHLGEGPHWSEAEGVLYYVDILKGRVLRYDPQNGGSCCYVNVYGNDPVSFVIPSTKAKEFMIGRGRDLCRLHWDFTQNPKEPAHNAGKEQDQGENCFEKPRHWVVVMAKVDRAGPYGKFGQNNYFGFKLTNGNCEFFNNRFNDGKCDLLGRLWAGTMGPEGAPGDVKRHQGSMYFCRQNLEDDKIALADAKFDQIDISNGLDWSPDGKVMYYIDSFTRKVEAFDFDASSGSLSNRRTVFDLKANGYNGFPDGMTIDTRGHLWVACFGSSEVLEINPMSGGKCESRISFDGLASRITSCAFGGPDLRDLYVTSAMDAEGNGGQVFVVRDTGAQGFAGRSFDPAAK